MAKKAPSSSALRTIFLCSACGNESPKWFGRCPHCNEWNTAVEEPPRASTHPEKHGYGVGPGAPQPKRLAHLEGRGADRRPSGIGQLDPALGRGPDPRALGLIREQPRPRETPQTPQLAG